MTDTFEEPETKDYGIIVPETVMTDTFTEPETIDNDDIIVRETVTTDTFEEPVAFDITKKIDKWWTDDRNIVDWMDKMNERLEMVKSQPMSLEISAIREQHGDVEKLSKDVSGYETNVSSLETSANDIGSDPMCHEKDCNKVMGEMKTVVDRWNNLKEKAFAFEKK